MSSSLIPPPVLLDILNKTTDWFKSKGIENPRLDAQLLLGNILGMKRLELYMNFDRPLNENELARYRELVRRRGQHEPLQHLLGDVQFRELTLKVDKRALIPRPETEIIIDLARKAILPGKANTLLDIGIGAGPIFLSLQKEISNCKIFGVDLSEDCLDLTRENAKKNNLSDENLFLGNLFSPFQNHETFDLILSNPPYIGEGEWNSLQVEVRDFDPRLALIGGPEGWELPYQIIEESYSRLNELGTLILEIGKGQFPLLAEKSKSQVWSQCRAGFDYNGI